MEMVWGAISTASTATDRPSSITRQPEASRSSSMTWFFCSEGDASWTSYLMAGAPVAHDGLPASSERAGLGPQETRRNADGGATRQATWCAPRRGENRVQQGCGGKAPHWS